MAEPDIHVLGCSPTSTGPAHTPGATEGTCRDCGTAVWISPSSREIMGMHPDLIIVCVPCVEKRMAAEPEPVEIAITPAQAAEVDAWDRRN